MLLNKFSALASAKEEGIKQGLEQGVYQRNIEIVKTAIVNGFDNSTISKLTGLSVDEIEKIHHEC